MAFCHHVMLEASSLGNWANSQLASRSFFLCKNINKRQGSLTYLPFPAGLSSTNLYLLLTRWAFIAIFSVNDSINKDHNGLRSSGCLLAIQIYSRN